MHTQDTTDPEEWRPIPGYDGIYSVSSLGRIRRDAPARNSKPGRILRASITRRYLKVCLARDSTKRGAMVHRIVAAVFIGPCPPKWEVNHKDGCKTNNAAANLEYTTSSGNKQHAKRLGLFAEGARHYCTVRPECILRGEASGAAKLTEEQVREIRAAYIPRVVTQSMLARRYGVSQGTVFFVLSGKNWGHVS